VNDIDRAWAEFITAHPAYAGRDYQAWGFGSGPEMADELGGLVAAGTKTATCSLLWEHERDGEPVPKPGDLSLILDGAGQPLAVIETTEVTIRPYDQVDAAFAFEEGEGDRSLATWREDHWRYFTRVARALGREPAADMPLACERFRLLHRFRAPAD
jgi:uncharacterized protein YhfF